MALKERYDCTKDNLVYRVRHEKVTPYSRWQFSR